MLSDMKSTGIGPVTDENDNSPFAGFERETVFNCVFINATLKFPLTGAHGSVG